MSDITRTSSSTFVGYLANPRSWWSRIFLQGPRRNVDPEECVCNAPSSSISEPVCRICHDTESEGTELVSPCNCRGTVAFTHVCCLEQWLSQSGSTACELCGHTFNVRRMPRLKASESLRQWLRRPSQEMLISHAYQFASFTPLTLWAVHVVDGAACFVLTEYLTSPGITRLAALLLRITVSGTHSIYIMWVSLLLRYHGFWWWQWFRWWRKDVIVHLILDEGSATERRSLMNDSEAVPRTCSSSARISLSSVA